MKVTTIEYKLFISVAKVVISIFSYAQFRNNY